MSLKLITAPIAEPVTLEEAKLHMRIDITDDDALVSAMVTAARQWCESFRRQSFVTQTWAYTADEWPDGDVIELHLSPVQSVTSIVYVDEAGASATVDAGDYIVDVMSEPGRLALKSSASWPSVTLRELNGVTVTYVTGYGLAAAVPVVIKQAILLLAAHLYENREQSTDVVLRDIPFGVTALLWPERVFTVK